MNLNLSPRPELVPAPEKARQMQETLDFLQAGATRHFSRIPPLMRALLRFFAMLRAALERLGQVQQPVPDVDCATVPQDTDVAAVSVARRRRTSIARKRVAVPACVMDAAAAARRVRGCVQPQSGFHVRGHCRSAEVHRRKFRKNGDLMAAQTHAYFVTFWQ